MTAQWPIQLHTAQTSRDVRI